jgi:CBS domain-containing membrane protein
VSIVQGTNSKDACDLLLYHNIRVLPVVDANGRLIGIVGLRELLLADETIDSVISQAVTASAGDPAVNLIPFLTDGKAHAAVIVDENRHILGIVTQTDLLASLARLLLLGQQAIDDTNR